MCFRFTFLLLCIVSLLWNYHSLDSLARVEQSFEQSNQQGLEHCRAFDKGFSLHRSIMPTSGESEEVNEEERILELKREKRGRKTAVTKTRHNLERLNASGEDSESIENEIETLWKVLDACLTVMEELQQVYLRLGDNENKKAVAEEAESLEKEVNNVIEKAERVIKDILEKKETLLQTPSSKSPPQPTHSPAHSQSSSSDHSGNCNQRLKPLKVPMFSGEKSKFEDFWDMFLSLVDQGVEPTNIKMARLRQSLTGTALEAIRGLGVSDPEYKEAKDILQSKFGGERRKLQAYMDQIEKMPPEVWYLPHFPVIRMDKTTTKVRIVFDCSAKTDGVSLNDAICAGPKLQKDLFDVLIRFRRNPIALACDIKEMYLQVEIEERDRPYFRLLWRDLDSSREPDVYEFSRVVFGKNSAPMEAQFVAQENARRHQDVYPLAAETVLKSTYMDDSIDSVETVQDGIQLYKELDSLWGIAGMKARKWVSNSLEVVAATPEADRATELPITVGEEPVVKTLGISWNSTEDTFTISAANISAELPVTKRNVLRKVATVFDPLGFVGPFVIKAKILLQELWTRGYDWDDTWYFLE